MEDNLISILEALGYPVILQGSLLPDEPYPDSFFTFWNDNTDSLAFYDNAENAINWDYSINFYSNNPTLVNTELLNAKTALKNNGWKVSGAGYSIMSDEQTHTGRGISVSYRQE